MGELETLIVELINEDQERVDAFLVILTRDAANEETLAAMQETFASFAPDCGRYWRALIAHAASKADWDEIATGLTDRRKLGGKDTAWMMVDRRRS